MISSDIRKTGQGNLRIRLDADDRESQTLLTLLARIAKSESPAQCSFEPYDSEGGHTKSGDLIVKVSN